MPFPLKVQPIDSDGLAVLRGGGGDLSKATGKSRFKRLFDWQFGGLRTSSSSERLAGAGDLEPSSVCLDKMVRNFMEDASEKPTRCGRSRCNCFHGNCDDSSDDDLELASVVGDCPIIDKLSSPGDASSFIKGLVVCASLAERNLLADASNIVAKSNKQCKHKDEFRTALGDGLRSLGYDASICKSRWEKTTSFPAGEYEYIDVIADGGERFLVDVDFRSEFEIARPTKSYKAVLQSLPTIFVGKEERLCQILVVVSEALRLSLKKRGLHIPPWRKSEYMHSKWLSSHTRSDQTKRNAAEEDGKMKEEEEKKREDEELRAAVAGATEEGNENAEEKPSAVTVAVAPPPWEPPEVKPKVSLGRKKVVAGLASVLTE